MSNWITITEDYVRMGKVTAFIDAMQSTAATRGDQDPLPEMIIDVIATIRASISTGNQLDLDTTKIPRSLKGLAIRLINRRVKGYLNQELTSEESKQADADQSYLNRITDQKLRFETPDAPAASSEMQAGNPIQVVDQVNSETQPNRIATRDRLAGL